MLLLILERQRGIGGEREKHESVASHMRPNRTSNPQPRYVPWLGIEPAHFWCMGWCSNQPSHLARAAQWLWNSSMLLPILVALLYQCIAFPGMNIPNFFNHSPFDGHLCCYWSWVNTKEAARALVCRGSCGPRLSSLLGTYLGGGVTGGVPGISWTL